MAQSRAREHLDDNYYSQGEAPYGNYTYYETAADCIEIAEEDTRIEARNSLIHLLQLESQLSSKAIKMIEEKFNEKYDL